MRKYVLSIDRGTTQIKVGLFDMNGDEVYVVTKPCPPMINRYPGWCEQDMDEIWSYVSETVEELWVRGYSAADVVCVGVTGQGNGIFLVDKDCKPVRLGIVPLDSRCEAISQYWKQQGVASDVKETNGFGIPSCSPLALLYWVKKNEPEVFDNIRWILFCKDWVRYRLTGEICTDYTDTSGAGLMDMKKREYAPELFSMLGIAEAVDMLPPVRHSYEIVGSVTDAAAIETGLVQGTPVICGAHDIAACSFGVGGNDEGHVVLVTGTIGLSLAVLKEPEIVSKNSTTLCNILPDKWLMHSTIRGSGSSLDWYLNLLCEQERNQARLSGKSVYDLVEEKLDVNNPSTIISHPYLFGDMDLGYAMGGITCLQGWNSREDVLLGIYQGLAYAYAQVLEPYQAFKKPCDIYMCGGGSKSKILGQIIADTAGETVRVAPVREAACRGVAISCLMSVDEKLPLPRREVPASAVFVPNTATWERHQSNFRLFKESQQGMRDIWYQQSKMDL